MLEAAADLGRASGLSAAAKLLLKLVDGRMRVVGTGEIKEVAASLQALADELRSKSKDTLNFYAIILNK